MTYQAQLEALAEVLPAATIMDGEWMVDAVDTQDTLADFEAAVGEYAEASKTISGEVAGLPFVAWSKVQVRNGDKRRSLAVIDFGDRRVAIDDDADYWDI